MSRRSALDDLVFRPAVATDQPEISALVRSERLNPTGLDWRRFVVAVDGRGLAGAVQVRHHPDGSRELGSLVVRPPWRGRGVASRLVELALGAQREHVQLITYDALVPYFARWGFRPLRPAQAPRAVRRNHVLGSLAGVISLLKGRRPRRLHILDRPPA